jgi:hypothetical protein
MQRGVDLRIARAPVPAAKLDEPHETEDGYRVIREVALTVTTGLAPRVLTVGTSRRGIPRLRVRGLPELPCSQPPRCGSHNSPNDSNELPHNASS